MILSRLLLSRNRLWSRPPSFFFFFTYITHLQRAFCFSFPFSATFLAYFFSLFPCMYNIASGCAILLGATISVFSQKISRSFSLDHSFNVCSFLLYFSSFIIMQKTPTGHVRFGTGTERKQTACKPGRGAGQDRVRVETFFIF